ncbi:MAG: OsmC family protein [Sedimenticola sp.]|uniref:OsmC family peroxiredoxin n=1 Tax=Sedimenticola thiotaurini TaxID=1543721 RepID=A0A558CT31_9GAMM|nr:OsmC family protein [Sedimenticola sp.]MCW8976401.1 OsmC family protein [Sedimenticola sp.]TVT51906.1 MAG: OsmC family peroxiredoxin [Sedimenticola thiotaurini]
MSTYTARITWQRGDELFVDNKYSRGHLWTFDGGVTVPASSSPHVVPVPLSVEANVDPEEAFVASLSSCHMLFFLALAAQQRFVVDSYVDDAVGVMGLNDLGKTAMLSVKLRPVISFNGEKQPTSEELESLHHKSHDLCFIANSVKTDVVVEPA